METKENSHSGEDYYEHIVEQYAYMKQLPHRQYYDKANYLKLIEQADLSEKDVIDLACGSGFYTRIIREQVKESKEVWGADISENMVKLAKYLGPDTINYQVADLTQKFPFDKQFDAISCPYLFQHAKNYLMLVQMLKNTFEMLKPGGWIFGSNGASMDE